MTIWHDVRIAARLLLKDRGLTLAAVTALALGIAATTTVFTIVNAVVLRDMPFDEPDRIVEIGTRVPQGNRGVSYLDLQDWRARTRTFEGIAGFAQTSMNVSDDNPAPERFQGAYLSADAFRLVGHQPIIGRNFLPEDERPGAPSVVMLGYSAWQGRYKSDRSVVGRTIRVNGAPSTVIGVMDEGFRFPMVADVWQPITLLPPDQLQRRDARGIGALGRMHAGVTVAQAQDDLGIVMANLAREYPATNADVQPRVTAFRLGAGPQVNVVMYALMGAVVFVLLIACANVANLLLARAADRTREVSVRMALGASRWDIVRQLLVESLLLASAGGVIGLGLSVAGVRLFTRAVTGTGEPYWLRFTMDVQVFAFFAAACLGTAVLFGLAPALHASKLNVSETLNESGRGTAGTSSVRRWAGALVILQLALAPALLAGAGLMIRTLLAAYQTDGGIDTAGLVRMRLVLPSQAYPTAERRMQFYRQLEDRLAETPNVRAALATVAPQEGVDPHEISFDGRPDNAAGARPVIGLMTIGLRYFDTLGVPLLRGRDFARGDGETGDVPAIVNARFAALHFPDEDPIGRRIQLKATRPGDSTLEWVTIVGLAPNVRQRDADQDRSFDPVVYVPYASNPLTFTSILVRSPSDLSLVSSQLRDHVRALDPDLPLFNIITIDELLAADRWPFRVFGSMFSIFAVIALIMASVGLYAVTSRSVAQRTREIGVRMALGAEAREIWWLVTRRVSIQIGIGLLIGMIGAVGVGQLLRSLIQVSATDPLTMIAVPLLLLLVAFGASVVPARRAMRLDPVAALRAE